MVRNIRIIAVIAAVMGGCGTTKPPPPKAKPAGAANAQQRPARQRPARRKNVDISADVMATAVFSSFEALLQRGISYVRPHLPKAARRLAGAGMLKAKLWSKLFRNAPGLESTLDLDRPFGLAVADPKIYRARGLGPLVLAVPLVDADKFVKILADAATHGGHRALDGGDHFIGDKVAGIYVRIVGRMAYVASVERLIQGAEGVMAPRLRKAPKLGGRLVVHMQRIYGRYKHLIDRGIARLKRQTSMMPDPGFFKYIEMVPSMMRLRAALDLRAQAVHGSLSVRAHDGSELAALIGKLNAGPAWGAELIPDDAFFAMLTRFSPQLQKERLGALVQMAQAALAALPRGLPIGAMLQGIATRWHAALSALVDQTSGESAAAIWSGKNGGIGFGTAVRAKDGAALRKALLGLTSTIAADVRTLVKLAAGMAKLPGVGVRIRARKGAFRAGKVRGDLVTFAIRYPRITKKLAGRFNLTVKEARARLAKIRKTMTLLFGKTSTMALVSTKNAAGEDVSLATFGRDYQTRIKEMLAATRGAKKGRLAGVVRKLVGKRPLVALFYSPLALLVEQVMRVVDQITTVPAQLQALVRGALPPAGRDVPLAFFMQTDRDRKGLRFEGSVSADFFGILVKAGLMFFTRASPGSMAPAPPPPTP
ncbi:MAG: hypothetical protein KC503_09275 [Myxococcales bacterium]|nr:hypothetical protein [Myxococcales bacterium]